jgi:PAS domain S-box-containing protein
MSISRKRSLFTNIPLVSVLIVPFVALTVGTVWIVGYLSDRSGHVAVQKMESQIAEKVKTHVETYLNNYLKTPQLINRLNANAFRLGQLDITNPQTLERHLLKQIREFNVDRIRFSTPQGGLVSAGKDDRGHTIAFTENFKFGTMRVYGVDDLGSHTNLFLKQQNYDVRQRPFYEEAIKASRPIWTSIFVYIPSSQGLGISASYPIYDAKNQLQAVLSSDLTLSSINNFLKTMQVSKNGEIFIIERSGLLVASSQPELLFVNNLNDRQNQRISANDSQNPLIRLTTNQLILHFGSLAQVNGDVNLYFDINGDRHLVQSIPIRDQNGLDWLAIVVIPESDFMTELHATNRKWMILLCGFSLVLSTGISLLTNRWIARPILRLSRVSEAMAGGEWTETLNENSNIAELNSLSVSFNQMAAQLHRSLDQKSTELQEKEYWFNILIEAIPDPIFLKDSAGRYLIINHQGLELFAMSDSDYFGKTDTEMAELKPFFHDALLYCAATDQIAWNKKEAHRTEERISQLDGSQSTLDVYRVPLFNESGDRKGLVVIGRDISDRKQTELVLAKAKTTAEEATRAKSAFLANMSHEIRTPMNGVMGMAQLLETTILTEEQADFIKTIKDSSEALLTIINDILDFSKIESGMLALEEWDFKVEDVVSGVCKLLLKQAISKQIDLQYAIAPEIPIVIGDYSRLRQILLNLVGNAIKFTKHGQILITVTGQALPEPNKYQLKFAIADTGIGIDSDRIDQLFQPFTQADASISRKYGGTGLGLAISKRLVELMHGNIWVESLGHVGGNPTADWQPLLDTQGSTFYFAIAVLTSPTIYQPVESTATPFPAKD